ncbi:MAG TPA: protease HtpX, partial [Succinivibrionaceae bacterium]|nr:protease HtpX [Succinivibrionaceae bacterium]
MATMLGVILLIGIIVNIVCYLFQINISSSGMGTILVLSAVMGFAGSIISLFLSKTMVKKSMRVQVITSPRTDDERWLLQSVNMLANKKGVAMPEVGIYPADEMNAFATGWNKDAALVAVSSGILRRMNRDELLAVLGHEMSHVQN